MFFDKYLVSQEFQLIFAIFYDTRILHHPHYRNYYQYNQKMKIKIFSNFFLSIYQMVYALILK